MTPKVVRQHRMLLDPTRYPSQFVVGERYTGAFGLGDVYNSSQLLSVDPDGLWLEVDEMPGPVNLPEVLEHGYDLILRVRPQKEARPEMVATWLAMVEATARAFAIDFVSTFPVPPPTAPRPSERWELIVAKEEPYEIFRVWKGETAHEVLQAMQSQTRALYMKAVVNAALAMDPDDLPDTDALGHPVKTVTGIRAGGTSWVVQLICRE